jgi:very-short-patch-repair endonuclease
MDEKNPRIKAVTLSRARESRRMMTPAERLLWEKLRGHQMSGFKFRRQHPIGSYIVDFYCPAKHLGIEVDGDSHEEQIEYDRKRTAILNKFGINVIRFTNQQVHEGVEAVLNEIQKVLNK